MDATETLGRASTTRFPLMHGENVVTTMNGRAVVVTDRRVRVYAETLGQSSMISLMLEEIASCRIATLTKPWMLIVAGVMVLGSLSVADDSSKAAAIGFLIAAGFALAYFLTRRNVVSIASAGAAIHIDIAGEDSSVDELIQAVETAKDARYRLLARQ